MPDAYSEDMEKSLLSPISLTHEVVFTVAVL